MKHLSGNKQIFRKDHCATWSTGLDTNINLLSASTLKAEILGYPVEPFLAMQPGRDTVGHACPRQSRRVRWAQGFAGWQLKGNSRLVGRRDWPAGSSSVFKGFYRCLQLFALVYCIDVHGSLQIFVFSYPPTPFGV